ncbi:MAG: universal stress protein [Bacteroidota bacterium]|nr:universal stress protein [Bacteroidota bacterium]
MQRKNRILSLLDFSEYSEKILRCSKSFSTYLQAEVLLIHQLPNIVTARASASVREQVYKAEREDAFERLSELSGSMFETTLPMIASQEDLTETLSNLKNNAYFDWLLVGLKGKSFLEQVFLGSKAVAVLDQTSFVTIAFPLAKEICFPEELVVALHADDTINSEQLKAVVAQLPGALRKITFVTEMNSEDQRDSVASALSRLKAEFEAMAPAEVMIRGGDVQKELERYLQDKAQSFLLVQESDPLRHDSVFKRGLINELVYRSTVPMIILPHIAKERGGGEATTM